MRFKRLKVLAYSRSQGWCRECRVEFREEEGRLGVEGSYEISEFEEFLLRSSTIPSLKVILLLVALNDWRSHLSANPLPLLSVFPSLLPLLSVLLSTIFFKLLDLEPTLLVSLFSVEIFSLLNSLNDTFLVLTNEC